MITMAEDEGKESISRCPICNRENTTITDHNSGEIICSNCGVVIYERIEDMLQPERHRYTIEEADRKARIGAPPSLAVHDMRVPTTTGRENKDASGGILEKDTRS